MGKSDRLLVPWYQYNIKIRGDVALLGFSKNTMFPGDLYDKSLGNWEINSDWELQKKYDTIISLRCPYFAKDPEAFIEKCYDHLNPNGRIFLDWGYGDHWRFEKYKVGWLKDDEQEYAYSEDNFLWSGIWDDSFLMNDQFKLFCTNVLKLGYTDVKHSIHKETPSLLHLERIKKFFDIEYSIVTLWSEAPQVYILLKGTKK